MHKFLDRLPYDFIHKVKILETIENKLFLNKFINDKTSLHEIY